MYEDSQLGQALHVLPIRRGGEGWGYVVRKRTGKRGWGLLGGSVAPWRVHLNERSELQQHNSQSCPTSFGTGLTAHSLGKRSSCLCRSFSVLPRPGGVRRIIGESILKRYLMVILKAS